jgi:ComF family protein
VVRRTIHGCASLLDLTQDPSVYACLERAKGKLVDFFFPPHCVGCGREREFICVSCRQSLPNLVPPLCSTCSKPMDGESCSSCRRWRLEINGIRSPYAFEGLMRQAIYRLKYGYWTALAEPLGGLLARYLQSSPVPMDAVVPVPLHPWRLRERGYNQSALLAREVGKLLSVPVVEGWLVRQSNGRAQVKTADAAERRRNVEGAFRCRDERLAGKHVVILDDVCTTGATLDSCAVALKKAGVASVWGLTLARET